MRRRAVFVASRSAFAALDRRVETLSSLSESFPMFQIFCQNGDALNGTVTKVPVSPPVTSLFRRAGLPRLTSSLNALLYFPSPRIRLVRRIWRRLDPALSTVTAAGHEVTLVTVAPPHDLGLLGLMLKTTYPAARWVMDWSDLWTYDEYYANAVPSSRRPDVERLEQALFDRADMNVVTNHRARRVVMERHQVPPDRIVAIPHALGAHEPRADVQALTSRPLRRPFVIGVLGGIFKEPKVPGDTVIATLGMVRSLGLDLKLRLIGDPIAPSRRSVAQPWIECLSPMSLPLAMQAASECDALLLALADLPNTRVIMHTKLADYLALEKPIIALVPEDSYAAEVVRDSDTGIVIPLGPGCAAAVHRGLLKLPPRVCPHQSALTPFRRQSVGAQWLEAIAPQHGVEAPRRNPAVASV